MEFTLKKFKATDVVIMATMLSKIGLGKVTDVFGKENIMSIVSQNENTEDKTAFTGMTVAFQVAEVLLGNIDKCQGELYTLLSHASGMTEDEVKELDAEVFFELIVAVVTMEQFKDFLKVASKLLNLKK